MIQMQDETRRYMTGFDFDRLQERFGANLRLGENMARYASSRVGGPVDALLVVNSSTQLIEASRWLWDTGTPFQVIGGGSNILVSDTGIHGIVILNQAKDYRFIEVQDLDYPQVWAESGHNFGSLARQAARRGFSGLEWAAGIPGTVGGAITGNAGAHGEDMSGALVMAGILQQDKRDRVSLWQVEKFEFGYRSSVLKKHNLGKNQPWAVVVDALFQLKKGDVEKIRNRMDELVEFRHRTQPPGASMGSMFKNPLGDYAGRLIEAAGLKGTRVGMVEISQLHANFFTNLGDAKARDVLLLIEIAQKEVEEKFGIHLELEIELLGEWD